MSRVPLRLHENLENAKLLLDQGQINRAARHARTAYAMAEEHLAPDHAVRKEAARTLGLLLLNLRQPEEAARLLEESGDRPRETMEDGDARDEIGRSNNETFLRLQQGDESVLSWAQQVLTRARASLPPDSSELSVAIANVGHALERNGDLKGAEHNFKEVLDLRRRALPDDDPLLVMSLMDVARMHLRGGRARKAEPLYREALRLQEAHDGPDHPSVGIILTQLASICEALGNTDEALAMLERSLSIRRSSLGPDHPQVAVALHGLASLHMNAENHDEADRMFEQACHLLDRSLGPDNPRSLQFLMERGMNRLGQGQATLGLQHLSLARDRATSTLPPSHPLRQQIDAIIDAGRELQRKLGT